MLNENDIALVENYLEGKLSGKELESFLDLKEGDPDFAQYIAFRQKIGDAWTTAGDYLEAKQWVKESLQGQYQSKKTNLNRSSWYAMAAVILILLGVYLIVKFSSQTIDETPGFASKNNEIEVNMGVPIEHKASIDTLTSEPLLKGTINGTIYAITDTLSFSWESKKSFKNLIISRIENDSVIMRVPLNKDQFDYYLSPGALASGNYYWYLDKPKVKAFFKIENE